MADKDLEAKDIERKVLDLAEAMGQVRSAQADRDDVVVDMKHAQFSRLELLVEDLSSVYDAIPDGVEQFEFAVTNGETPRLWIDMTSFVRMGGDGREYEFVKDTRMGRVILARSTNRTVVGEKVTEYVAERLLERERMIEGDWVSRNSILLNKKSDETSVEDENKEQQISEAKTKSSPFFWVFAGLAIGLVVFLILSLTGQIEPLMAEINAILNRF